MVNNQTSQYKLLNTKLYWSHLGVFQSVRDILQSTVFLDHSVVCPVANVLEAVQFIVQCNK